MNTVIEAPKQEVKPEIKPAKKANPSVLPNQFSLAQYKRNDWVAEIHHKYTVNDILDPAFWAHVAAEMNPFDIIEARWEDGSRIVNLRVVYCERTYAKVKIISTEDLADESKEVPAESLKHRIDWKGPHLRFCVIRNSDNEILSQGHKERGQASAWMTDYERT